MGFTTCDTITVNEDMTPVRMLRMAVGALDLDATAIRGAIDVLGRLLPESEAVQWTFVYASVDGDRARDLPERQVAWRALADVDPRLKVGWMKISNLNGSRKAALNAFETASRDEEARKERPAKRAKYE